MSGGSRRSTQHLSYGLAFRLRQLLLVQLTAVLGVDDSGRLDVLRSAPGNAVKLRFYTLGYASIPESIPWGKFGAICPPNHANPGPFRTASYSSEVDVIN